jgi:hypothetical protein
MRAGLLGMFLLSLVATAAAPQTPVMNTAVHITSA